MNSYTFAPLLQLLFSDPVQALVILLSLVVAITFHEFAHAWVADYLGDETPRLMGRVTLNPAAHLDPIGSIAFLLFGFGWGKPVIYNPMRLSRKVDELLIALAGPASNILLAILLNLLAALFNHSGFALINPDFLSIAAFYNVLLAAFNMIPIPPLDGSSIVAYFWPEYRSLVGGRIGLIILLIVIFIPVGPSGSILTEVLTPIITFFSHVSTLFGLIG